MHGSLDREQSLDLQWTATLRETPSVAGHLTRAMVPNYHRSEKSRPYNRRSAALRLIDMTRNRLFQPHIVL